MQMIFKVTVQLPEVGSMLAVTRTFLFLDRQEANNFTKLIEQRTDGVKVVLTSIDHLIRASEALDEIDEEMDMAMRVAYTERL